MKNKEGINMKKTLLLILTILVYTSFCVKVDASVLLEEINYKKSLIEAYGTDYEEYLENNWKQVQIAEQVDNLLKNNYFNNYPEYYGGMYISDDSLNLIVQIVKDVNLQEKDLEVIEKIISLNKNIIIEYVENSYNKLISYNNEITKYIENNDDEEIQSNYIDVINNKVTLEISSDSDEKMKKTVNKILSKSRVNDKMINYRDASQIFLNATTIKAGQKYQVVGWECSTGFRTKYNGKNGVVTAGHCLDKVGADTQIGKIRVIQFKNNESYDYGFIETESNYTLSNDLAYPYSGYKKLAPPNNTSPLIVVNMAIAKSGFRTGYTAGKVTSINTGTRNIKDSADPNKSYNISGLISASYNGNTGDSGAPVFVPKSDLNGSILIGIHNASGGGESLFTSINDIPNSLKSGRY